MAEVNAGAAGTSGSVWPKLLFLCVACYYWITLTPFVDLSQDPTLAKPAWWTLAVTVVIFLALMAYALRPDLRNVIARPRLLLLLVFGWLLLTAALAPDPANTIKRVAIAFTVCLSASAFLLLPKSEKQFSRLLGTVVFVVLALCYFGILFLPRLTIHQTDDFLQPNYPGLWHGIYVQKNEAGVVMVMFCFIGIYLASAWSRAVGVLIFVASAIFLLKTGSKTSTLMLPMILVLSYVFEHWRRLRALMVFGGVAALNLATVGVVAFPAVKALIASVGIDPTYTARSDIWKLALQTIGQSPIVGYGLQSFWQSASLVHSDRGAFTWATHAVDAHNAYLDAAITAGIPGLVLIIVWVLVTPLRDLRAIDAASNFTPLTRLFLRIWLFGIFLACLESVFLANSGPTWFMLLVAMFGLRFQARYSLVPSLRPEIARAPAFA